MFGKDRFVMARCGDGFEVVIFSDRLEILRSELSSLPPSLKAYPLPCAAADIEDARTSFGSLTLIEKNGTVWRTAAGEPKLRRLYNIFDVARAARAATA